MSYNKMRTNSGVSLVELAVVILILGILTVVISGGSKLIEQSKVQGLILEVDGYKSAFNTFKAKYEELPGDMTASSALAWFGVTNESLNGSAEVEGDGYITAQSEGPMAFWHMQLDELIEGNYNGLNPNDEVPGVNVGFSKYSSESAFNFNTLGHGSNSWGYGTTPVYNMDDVVALVFGNVYENWVTAGYSAVTPEFARKVDRKMDDGIPYKGAVLADHGLDVSVSTCTDYADVASNYSSSDGVVSYQLDDSTIACRMMFVVQRDGF